MKIVQCVTLASSDGAFGGPLAVAIEQCRELAALGHDVTLLAGWDGELRLNVPGVRVVLARGRRVPGTGFSGIFSRGLTRWLRQNRDDVDVMHVHLGRHLLDLTMATAAEDLGIPTVVQTHGMVMPDRRAKVQFFDRLWTRDVLRRAAAVLTLSDEESAGVRQVQSDARVRTVRNGVTPIARVPETTSAGHEVLFLSRLHPRKRVMAFAEAAAEIAESHPAARFTVIGPDEGDLDRLQALMARRPDVPLRYEGTIAPGTGSRRIADAEVFVLPSVGEVFPMALLEALAAGTPVVMTSDCAIAPALESAGAAIVTDGSSEAIANAIDRLLSDEALRESLRSAGAMLVENELGARAIARDLVDMYTSAPRARRRIVWMTNQAAPYRVPLWKAIAEHADLEVWLLESDKRTRRDDNNRGDDWAVAGRDMPFRFRTIPSVAIRRGEARHYVSGLLPIRRRDRIDAVLIGGWDSPAYWMAALAARRAGIRRVGFYESHTLSQRHRRGPAAAARSRFFRSMDAVVVPGVAARDALSHDGVSADRLRVGFNAVDVRKIHEDATRHRNQQSSSDRGVTGIRLVVAAQLIERKNVRSVIDALTRTGLESATLTVVGTGPLASNLTQHAERVGVSSRTHFLGHVPSDRMAEVFADHDVLVHVPTEEVWGLVVNEALAAGLHVIVSDRAGVAPSVAHMAGVSVIPPTTNAIASSLKDKFGVTRVVNPEILQHGPQQFAQVFLEALLTER